MIAGGAASAGLLLASSSNARADESCAHVVESGAFAPDWARALVELRQQIALLKPSECRPMVLTVETSGAAARLIAITPDGRRAERPVGWPESLVATALGLIMAIPIDLPPPPAPPVPVPPLPPAPPPTVEAPVVGRAPPPLALWAGFAGGVRLTAPTGVTVVDVEARTDLLLGRWLAMATIRSAVASCTGTQGLDCDVYNDVSLGLGVGRRLLTTAAAIDLALEPSVVWMHMEFDAPGGSEGRDTSGSEVVLRVDASARLAVPLGASWALTLTVDGGFAPAMLASPTRIATPVGSVGEPPVFPAWTGGVRVGASGALL
jgi:hypothetical protein